MTIPDPIVAATVEERRMDTAPARPDRQDEIEAMAMLQDHGRREGEALSAYQQLIEDSTDPAVRYLGQLILEDERRHHRVIEEMLHELQSAMWEVDVEPGLPSMTARIDADLLGQTRRLLDFEREDAKELRRLRKSLRSSPSSSLLPLLVELIIHDTAKHIEILKFIKAHAARR